MRAYYLDVPLTADELREAADFMHEPIEQVRIPHVLPVVDSSRPIIDDDVILDHLRRAGLLRDAGRRVVLIAPRDSHWLAALGRGIERLTGALPYLLQTEGQRDSVGNPGALRVVDMEGLAGGGSSRA